MKSPNKTIQTKLVTQIEFFKYPNPNQKLQRTSKKNIADPTALPPRKIDILRPSQADAASIHQKQEAIYKQLQSQM